MKIRKAYLVSGVGAAAILLMTPWATLSQQVPSQAGQAPPAAGAGAGTQGTPGTPGGGGRGRGPAPFDYEDNEGWLQLFDGTTLNNWEGNTSAWSVKDGAIYIQSTCEKPSGTIYLHWTGGEPSDFEIKFEFKGTGNINGGLQYRSYMTADTSVAFRYPGRGGGGTLGRGAAATAATPGAPGGAGAAGAGRAGAAGRGGRGPACANPGTPPTAEERAKFNMNGPQFDFDANNSYPGQYYEQGGRGIAASPGQVVVAEPGQPRKLLATIADKDTLNSWFHKDDYNQFLLIAKGNTSSMFMNGHLISVFIDNDPMYFRPSGKIGIEVESTGELFTRNIWLKRL